MSVLSWEEYEKENVLGIVDNLSILLQFPLQTFPVAMSHAEGFWLWHVWVAYSTFLNLRVLLNWPEIHAKHISSTLYGWI